VGVLGCMAERLKSKLLEPHPEHIKLGRFDFNLLMTFIDFLSGLLFLTYVCMYAYMSVCLHVCMYVCMDVYVCMSI
jgi:hypothetical protein